VSQVVEGLEKTVSNDCRELNTLITTNKARKSLTLLLVCGAAYHIDAVSDSHQRQWACTFSHPVQEPKHLLTWESVWINWISLLVFVLNVLATVSMNVVKSKFFLLLCRMRRLRSVGLWSLRITLVLGFSMLATLTRKQQNSLHHWFRCWCFIENKPKWSVTTFRLECLSRYELILGLFALSLLRMLFACTHRHVVW